MRNGVGTAYPERYPQRLAVVCVSAFGKVPCGGHCGDQVVIDHIARFIPRRGRVILLPRWCSWAAPSSCRPAFLPSASHPMCPSSVVASSGASPLPTYALVVSRMELINRIAMHYRTAFKAHLPRVEGAEAQRNCPGRIPHIRCTHAGGRIAADHWPIPLPSRLSPLRGTIGGCLGQCLAKHSAQACVPYRGSGAARRACAIASCSERNMARWR
jgi:hypothetical protein